MPALLALALFVFWATDQAGYPLTHWAPGALIVVALLAISLAAIRLRAQEMPVTVRVALLALAAFTALSYLSIAWAAVPGDAWEGANRTLLYLAVFALFAAWRQRGATAALLVGAWTLALAGLALFTVAHLAGAGAGRLPALLPEGRLVYPSGYANANAAQWLMAFWPALLLGRSRRLHWSLRGLLAGAAVLLAEVALLSQSRGSLYATPVMLVLVFAFLPSRTRTFALLLPVGVAIGAAAPFVLRVGDRLRAGEVVPSTLHHALLAIAVAALAAAVAVAAGGAIESQRKLQHDRSARLHRLTAAAAVAVLVVVIAGGLIAAGNPVTRLEHGWNTFKGGYAANSKTSDRLVGGLGSNRYDFFRVALDEFKAHPLLGIGADNFQQQYLQHGRSTETPRYPHSVELRTLAQTGLLGSALAIAGLLAALLAAALALREADELHADGRGGSGRGVRLLGRAWLLRLVLGVRGSGRAGVRAARSRLWARTRPWWARWRRRERRRRRGRPGAAAGPGRGRCGSRLDLRGLAGGAAAQRTGGRERSPCVATFPVCGL